MPQDCRRFNGPEDSIPYQRFTKDFVKTYDEQLAELLDDNGKRKDGRPLDEARSMFSRVDVVSQAKGSAYVEFDKTKVACSVFDPREIPHQSDYSILGQIYCEVKYAPYSCYGERRTPVPDAEMKALSVALKKALESCVCLFQFPNFQIDIFVYILENDGGCLAAAINCAGLALADAAVPMYDIITSLSLAVIGDQVFVDPNYEEETLAIANTESNTNHGTITMAILPALRQITNFRQVGSMDMACLTDALDVLERECVKIQPNLQQVILANVVECIEERKEQTKEEQRMKALMDAKMDEWVAALDFTER